MIDFRYHVVSIVSIFLALAVGIVLGAGPLQGQIGDTLTQEVTTLREDRQKLRDDLSSEKEGAQARDAFVADAADRLVEGRLTGATVAVVTLPTAEAAVVTATIATLESAGARVVSRTAVQESWISIDQETRRVQTTLAEEHGRALGVAAPADGAPLDHVLAATLLRPADQKDQPVPAADAARQALAGARLIQVSDNATRADLVVVVGGPITDGDQATREAQADRWVALATALDSAARGGVLVSDVGVTGVATTSTSIVTRARADAAFTRGTSSVDDASLPMGQISIVYALIQQQTGGVGQFGLEPDASAPYPPVPAS